MWKRTARGILTLFVLIGLSTVVVVGTPVADHMALRLRVNGEVQPAQAIVILGGGAFSNDLPSIPSLTRAVYGFSLFKAGYAPRILLAGGRVDRESGWEARAMRKLLGDIGAPSNALQIEERSTRTYRNAMESAKILHKQGANRILLITHPNHMRRAKWTFEKAGFIVYPAPVPWDRLPRRTLVPDVERVRLLYSVLYEYAGILFYWWRGWL